MPPTNIKLPIKSAKTKEKPVETTDRLINNITFFGDSAIPEDDPIYKSVYKSAEFLANKGYTIVNGGGPGIMKAATDGAESVNGRTIAVYWQPKLASFFEGRNLANVTDESGTASNYLIRTLGLIEAGDAYVVCKGGTGTISEFGMVWCLAKLYYGSHKPVILFGNFWDNIIESFQKNMYIDEIELSVLYQATNELEILVRIQEHEVKLAHCRTNNKKKIHNDETGFVLGMDAPELKTFKAYNLIASDYHSQYAGKLIAQDQLDEFMALINPPAKILDVGSGPGHDAGYLAKKFAVTGIELSKRFYQISKYEYPGIDFINADITKHELKPKSYKGIWARDSLHHIKEGQQDQIFQKLADSLVQGGILYVIVREGQGEVVEQEKSAYATTEKFFHLFNEEELRTRAEKAGLQVVRIDKTKRSHHWLVGVFKKK